MSLIVHDVGDSRRITAVFKDIDGNNADPTGVSFKMKDSANVETIYVYGTDAELVRPAQGVYYVDWTFVIKGYHRALFNGTGAIETAVQYNCYAKATI